MGLPGPDRQGLCEGDFSWTQSVPSRSLTWGGWGGNRCHCQGAPCSRAWADSPRRLISGAGGKAVCKAASASWIWEIKPRAQDRRDGGFNILAGLRCVFERTLSLTSVTKVPSSPGLPEPVTHTAVYQGPFQSPGNDVSSCSVTMSLILLAITELSEKNMSGGRHINVQEGRGERREKLF